MSCRAEALGDGVEHGALAVSRDGWILQDAAQLIAFLEQGFDAVQFLHYARGIEEVAFFHHNIGEGTGVGSDYGSHGYWPSFPPSLPEASFEAKVRTST